MGSWLQAQVVAQHGELLLVAANDVAESMQRELGFPAMVPQVLQLCAARPDCQVGQRAPAVSLPPGAVPEGTSLEAMAVEDRQHNRPAPQS